MAFDIFKRVGYHAVSRSQSTSTNNVQIHSESEGQRDEYIFNATLLVNVSSTRNHHQFATYDHRNHPFAVMESHPLRFRCAGRSNCATRTGDLCRCACGNSNTIKSW